MARTDKHRNKIPDNIPAGVRCIPLSVPDDPEWLAMLQGAVKELIYPFRYDKNPPNEAFPVGQLWQDVTYQPLVEAIRDGLTCETSTPTGPDNCTIISPVHPAVGYFPNHPILTPGTGFPWPAPAWCTGCNLPGLGQASDVLIRIDSAPFFTDLDDLLASGVPSFTLYFSGQGEIDLRFAAVPVGGTVWVFPDGNPLVGQMVDLEWVDLDDFAGTATIEVLIGILQGTLANQTTVTHEVEFTTVGPHTLTGWFFPKVETVEWPPLGWGGGLRSIQLCGDSITLTEAVVDVDLQCNASTLELLIGGAVKTTIDLDVCHPHPAPPAIPDYTLNRNNGDLQLLKDGALNSSAVYPNYHTSYNKATHMLEFWRDTLIIDQMPMPAYTLVKPSDDVIELRRDATELDSSVEDKFLTYRLQASAGNHELTEDAVVVSSVVDNASAGADEMIWHEIYKDLRQAKFGTYASPSLWAAWALGVGWVEGSQGFRVGFNVQRDHSVLAVRWYLEYTLINPVKVRWGQGLSGGTPEIFGTADLTGTGILYITVPMLRFATSIIGVGIEADPATYSVADGSFALRTVDLLGLGLVPDPAFQGATLLRTINNPPLDFVSGPGASTDLTIPT